LLLLAADDLVDLQTIGRLVVPEESYFGMAFGFRFDSVAAALLRFLAKYVEGND
jgi:hypothetical protein